MCSYERLKIARCCGAKRVSKSKCTKHTNIGPFWKLRRRKSARRVVARSTFPSQTAQNTPFSDHFWKLTCRKSHAGVARSTFPSQNVQNTPTSDHFWKLTCRKSHAGVARSTFPSQNVQKHTNIGPLLEVDRSKKCTPLWREADFQVKSVKTDGYGTLLDVQMSFRVVGARVAHLAKNQQKNVRVL